MSHPVTAVFPAHVLDLMPEVERRLQAQAESREPRLEAWSQEPVAAGGKRIRPILLLTSFFACKPEPTQDELSTAIDAAVALELVHTASLVHDDIMDESAERRGRPSTYAAHGRDGAILVGDYLFTQAFALAASLPKDAMHLTADACRRLCEGQLRERRVQEEGSTKREDYAAVIRDKTAVLLTAACGIGAIMAGAPEAQVDALTRYGTAIGHAFQVLDDVLDVTGDPQWTGKPAGTDYVAGTHSSPYLHFMERGGQLPTERVPSDFPEVRAKLFDSGAVAASQLEASTYTQDALLRLESLPDGAARTALARLAELLMERSQ
ncbi:MAG: polyprenyl synthetase family protein [Thermoplasmatota archaeon]